MNNFDLCRQNLLDRLNISTQDKKDSNSVSREIRKMSNALDEIVSLAKPRLIMGGIRYGSNWEYNDLLNYIQSKLLKFNKTGNVEMLIDIINLASVMYTLQLHPNHHFKEEDRK